MRLWDLTTGQIVRDLVGDREAAVLAFSPDGRHLATARAGRGRRHWDTHTGERIPLKIVDEMGAALAFAPDGRYLACGGMDDGPVRLLEVATGSEVRTLPGCLSAHALAFSRDGRLLAGAAGDNTVVVWDLSGRFRGGRLVPASLSAKEREALWDDLAANDAARAYRAVQVLGTSPAAEIVPFLKERLRPEPDAHAAQVAAWLRDLDSADFATRQEAARRLETQGARVAAALRKALDAGPSAEAERRLRDLVAKAESMRSPLLLRRQRAASALRMADSGR